MDIALKLSLLDQIYRLFDDFAGTENVACKKQCASCCTCNMTLTTLEGYKIISLLDARAKSTLMQQVCDAAEQKRFKPQITTNRMARRCMTGQELPQDVIDPAWGSCPLLFEKECRIYSMRPFGCRCMMSKTNCAETGYADMDEFTLSVATLFNQFIEHLDQDGMSGNLVDIILFLKDPHNREAYQSEEMKEPADGLIHNTPMPVLMIPPEHRKRIQPLLTSLSAMKIRGHQTVYTRCQK